jgi:hypothetical protein
VPAFPSLMRNNSPVFELISKRITWVNVAQLLGSLREMDEIGRSVFVQCQTSIVQNPLRRWPSCVRMPGGGDQGASLAVWPYRNGSSTKDGNLD